MNQVLLLNSSYEILGTMPLHQAIKKLMKTPSVLHIEEWEDDRSIRTSSGEYPIPSVVRLKYYLNQNKILKRRTNGTVSRFAIFHRDNFQCQYCGLSCKAKDLTLDHILPRSRGGSNAAHNLVTACQKCNGRKANRTPEEARMPLIMPLRPIIPSINNFSYSRYINANPKWKKFLSEEVLERFAA